MNHAGSLALLPFGGLYAAAVKARLALFNTGVLKPGNLSAPVISVGNITAGGTGKTPLVEWIARFAAQEGARPCILTRGYSRENPNHQVVVSNGNEILASVFEAGDEPLLLAENLAGAVAVICNRDRTAAGRWAIAHLDSNVFILDDGFQHLRLARQLNIVTIDATNPWSNGRVLPAGLLREPRGGLARADCVVVTRANQSTSVDRLRHAIDRFSNGKPIFLSSMENTGLLPLSSSTEPAPGNSVSFGAFCAVGNPQSFFAQLQDEGRALVSTRTFRDHHLYTQADIDEIAREAAAAGAKALITTTKDAVKLRALKFDLPAYVAGIEIEIQNDAELRQMIRNAITAQ